MYYKQCTIKKFLNEEHTKVAIQVAYIPEQFAKPLKTLTIKMNGEWEYGWVVTSVPQGRVHEDLLPDSHAEIKGHRKQTGDSLRK